MQWINPMYLYLERYTTFQKKDNDALGEVRRWTSLKTVSMQRWDRVCRHCYKQWHHSPTGHRNITPYLYDESIFWHSTHTVQFLSPKQIVLAMWVPFKVWLWLISFHYWSSDSHILAASIFPPIYGHTTFPQSYMMMQLQCQQLVQSLQLLRIPTILQ